MSNPYSLHVLFKSIEHLQTWMNNNPKYSEEFKSKAKYKDKLHEAIITIRKFGLNNLPQDR